MAEKLKAVNPVPFDRMCMHLDQMLQGGGEKVFAELCDGSLTYVALAREMRGIGAAFGDIGIVAGDRVLIVSNDERAVICLFFGSIRAGLTPVLGDCHATACEIGELVSACRPAVLVIDANALAGSGIESQQLDMQIVELKSPEGAGCSAVGAAFAKLRSGPVSDEWPRPVTPPDVAVMVFTSGTTSAPKAVELTHGNLIAQLEIFADVYGFDEQTRLLNLLPLHHVDGLIRGPLAALWFGGSLHRPLPFTVQNVPGILAAVAADRVTHFISVPAMLRIVERAGCGQANAFQTPQFRFVLSSADMLDAQLWKRFETTFGVTVANSYGLSEVVCDALFAGPDEATRRIGSLGRPIGCTVEILDDNRRPVAAGVTGELVISGPTVMRGYFEAPDATAMVLRDGAFHTGDYFRVGDDGLYEFVGRKKTEIVSAGVTLHPESVSSVLSVMPGVAEAIAFGVPDATRGERLVAALVPAPGQAITVADASTFCREQLSPERTPSEFRILEALPRGASGKVLLAELVGCVNMPAAVAPTGNVVAIAAQCFNVPAETLSSASTPFNTEGWDSLAHMMLIDEVEAAYDFQFTALQITQITSIGDVEELVQAA